VEATVRIKKNTRRIEKKSWNEDWKNEGKDRKIYKMEYIQKSK
jgi:hypothetical protein